VAFAGLFFLVESGQGPFDKRRQKAWLLPATSLARYLLLCISSAAGRVKLSKWN
jgi:hypothetical protein